jgi:hypothetical protein
MVDERRDGLFLKIGPIQAAAYGPLAVLVLALLVVFTLVGRAIGWW